jgi:hypothetical protein
MVYESLKISTYDDYCSLLGSGSGFVTLASTFASSLSFALPSISFSGI